MAELEALNAGQTDVYRRFVVVGARAHVASILGPYAVARSGYLQMADGP